jgi:glutaredoxin
LREVNTANSVSVGPASDDAAADRVVLYSTAWCGYCDRARAYRRRNDIAFREYDVEASRCGQRYRARTGIDRVPIIRVGDRRMVGFTPERFEALYAP